MKKIFAFIVLSLSIFIFGCSFIPTQNTYYSVTFEYDESKVQITKSGIMNSEEKYYGDVEISFIGINGYLFDYAIETYSNTMVYEEEFIIEGIARDYNYQVFMKKDMDSALSEYYDGISSSLSGSSLKNALRNLITTTHTYKTTYDDCKKLSYISKTDGDPNKEGYIILFWSNISIPCLWDNGTTWNREHVWPQSQGWFNTSEAGSDLHHIRPTDPSVNTSHGNDPYADLISGSYVKTSSKNGSIKTECLKGSGYFEPADNRKGDTARIIFYLLTRYPDSDKYSITKVAQSMDLLLKWNDLDPVDQLEINRNNEVYKIQGNRNPFIDNSDYADMIWG